MYFVRPSRSLTHVQSSFELFADLKQVSVSEIATLDEHFLCIADVQDFLLHRWAQPTIVIALAEEGEALSQAWQHGALAGWIWSDLPKQPFDELKHLQSHYKREQDSRDLPTAAALQRCLLPQGFELESYRFRQLFQPSAYLSGDWLDYWQVDQERVLFYLADVSGHGVASSLLTSWLAAFHGRAATPLHLLEKLNRMLIEENIEKHITIIAGSLNVFTHEIECYNAGHFPPAVLLTPDQAPTIVESSSLPLGFDQVLHTKKITLTIPPQGKLILCSDGALELFEGGVNEQLEQLIDHLKQGKLHIPSQINDDVALLSIMRLDTGQTDL